MPMQPFGPWRPDIYTIGSEFSSEVKNALPSSSGWKPFPSIETISAAVGGIVRGAYVARSSTGTAVLFCGTATKLYKFDGTSAFTEVTRSSGGDYTLVADEYWSFDQQDNLLYAVQAGDAPQWINVDSGTNFAALGGSPPLARYVKAVGDFLFLLDLASAQGSVASSGRIQFAWSGIRDFDHWTYRQKSSDFGTLFSGGVIMGMTSPITGLILQEKAVNRIVRTGDSRVWDAARIEGAQGTRSPHSPVEHAGVLYYYGVDGFAASSQGAFTQEFGTEWVDEWFKAEANLSRVKTIIGALDPTRPRLFWLFPSAGNSSYTHDRVIGWDKVSAQGGNGWFHAELSASFLFPASTFGVTLENLGAGSLGYAVDEVSQSITDITQANPAVVTYSGSDIYADGMKGDIASVGGMTEVNGNRYTIAGLDTGANTFQLSGIDSSAYTTYTSGGTFTTVPVPYSLDSDVWKGGAPRLGAFDGSQLLGYLTGPALEATFRTSLFEPVPGRRGFVRGFRPVTNAASVQGRVAVAERPQDTPVWLASAGMTAQGLIPARASGRQFMIENTIAAGEEWDDMKGVDFAPGDLATDGER